MMADQFYTRDKPTTFYILVLKPKIGVLVVPKREKFSPKIEKEAKVVHVVEASSDIKWLGNPRNLTENRGIISMQKLLEHSSLSKRLT